LLKKTSRNSCKFSFQFNRVFILEQENVERFFTQKKTQIVFFLVKDFKKQGKKENGKAFICRDKKKGKVLIFFFCFYLLSKK
jgi:hypothetical protein